MLRQGACVAAVILAAGAAGADETAGEALLLDGYDPVAYFAGGAPSPGDPAIRAHHREHVVLFVSEAHRRRFATDPERYVPAYEGLCALGMALGERVPGDPEVWGIHEGRLYLFLDPGTRGVWMLDAARNRAAADRAWRGRRAASAVSR